MPIAQFQRFLIASQCHVLLKAPRGEMIFRTVLRNKTVRVQDARIASFPRVQLVRMRAAAARADASGL